MEPPTLMALPANYTPAKGLYSRKYKRMKLSNDGKGYGQTGSSTSISSASDTKKLQASSRVRDYSDPFAVCNMLKSLDTGKYGSVTKEIEELAYRKTQLVNYYLTKYPSLSKMLPSKMLPDLDKSSTEEASKVSEEASKVSNQAAYVINLDDDDDDVVVANHVASSASPIVIPDSDDEDNGDQRPLYPFQEARAPFPFREALTQYPFQEVVLGKPKEEFLNKDIPIRGYMEASIRSEEKDNLIGDIDIEKDKGLYVGVEDDANNQDEIADDGLGDIWKEMAIAIECSKEIVEEPSANEHPREDVEECDHSFMLKDDIGYVCCICGVIQRGIETIIEVQYNKAKRSTRTYLSDSRNAKDRDSAEIIGVKLSEDDSTVTNISAHPRHMNQMKPHQLEGFNFLCSNLVSESPGGCIMAHAPGSGKTFMIISFMQSFLAKYPYARPLVVLPKGILATWKKEFQVWQIEDIPLFDLYSVKADNRAQQLEVLKQWVEQKSILFLGYKQFSSIVCDDGGGKVSAACQEILLKAPSILILDEGHTPRNENTHVLQSLARVQTPRKVVLSGTLYQNHVKEVFNILNLVRPKFLRMHASKAAVKRILSRVHIAGVRKQFKTGGETAFYDLVEHTLQKDDNFKRKVSVIQDLREMTSKVLHYYKGDFLDELPGLADFTVVLNLSTKQKTEVQKLKKKFERKFKIASVGSAVYLHPKLNSLSESSITTDYKMDEMLEKLDVRDGVKAKFFLNMINLCESAGEKLLVFSQYLVPLKFLERLAVKTRGWRPGREMFMISGESSAEHREWSMERFNNSPDAKVFFGSIKACGEGISLVGASRIIIVDVPLNPSVTRQAIGRAFRPGQKKKVYAYRLVAADSPEEEDHKACFKKELISKMWFEWNEYCGHRDFQVETIGVDQCGDLFLESSMLKEDVKVLYRR